jgi:lipoprotein-anchoring transpeptidase ErfK/SrfK
VLLVRTPWRVDVDRAHRVATIRRDGKIQRRFRVVVGASPTPTPTGLFAIYERLQASDPSNFEGTWQLNLTAFSRVLPHFDGGPGQVALHGRGGASLLDPLGSARSHGCIRFANASISWMANHLREGTPVQIR